ncbi:MAG: Lrp/AsnC family transcriptional regulator [Candidatus Bathyarchaeota archaeon]|nr:Lrp/AsnC family transcriptional regulator [Candidatus Bathyarchaeota archaeon]
MESLDKRDIEILKLLQRNCRMTAKEMAKKIGSPITTVYAKIKRMEELGVIKQYKAILDSKKLDKGAAAFILTSFVYRPGGRERPLSQRDVAKQIAAFPEVQEVHIITGGWDILIKVKADHVDTLGKFVMDKLRIVEGIENTLSCIVYETVKETTDILT